MNRDTRNIKTLRKSTAGQMPFALIAVTLLILGSAYGVVYASIERSEETTDNITEELMTVGDAIDDTRTFIEAGMGTIIGDLSRSGSGSLIDRISRFDGMVDTWMSKNFPLSDKGVTAEIVDYNIGIGVETLKLSSDDVADASKASYLKATGYAVVDYVSSAGTTEKRLNISADGVSGLPFVIENATRFELSSSGEASVLTSLMMYQLSALAQYRVINGYGALSEGGDKGTRAILTEQDVEKSFRDSLSIIESLCFRDTGDGNGALTSSEHVDAAEMMTLKNGYYDIDVSAIYSQTLLSMLDAVLLRWVDYFYGGGVLGVVDGIFDRLNSLLSLVGCGSGNESAMNYIKSVMEQRGYSENEYRYLNCGQYSVSVPATVVMDADNRMSLSKPFTVTGYYPNTDLLSWDGWNDFVDRYHEDRNDIVEYMRGVLKTVMVGSASDAGSFRIAADPYDGESFSESLSNSLSSALNNSWNETMTKFESTIRHETISDPLFVAIYEEIEKKKDDIFGLGDFEKSMMSHLRTEITSSLDNGEGSMKYLAVEMLLLSVNGSGQCEAIAKRYSDAVDERLELFEYVLTDIPKSNDSLFKNTMIDAGKRAISDLNILPSVKETAKAMCENMTDNMSMNPRSGVGDLDGKRSYVLYDSEGNRHEEIVRISDDVSVDVDITQPKNNGAKCVHTVGIREFSLTPYTSVFTVSLKAIVGYKTTSTSAILDALGTYDSAVDGRFAVDTSFDIPCVSGWALTGVGYQASTTVLEELWEMLLEFLEPILEPLRSIYSAVEELFDICSTAIVEVSAYISDLIMKFYEAIEKPIGVMQEFIDTLAMETVAGIVEGFDIGLASQSITFGLMGMTVTIETKLATLMKTTKTILKASIEGSVGDTKFSSFIEIKENQKNGYMLRGGGGVEGSDWSVNLSVDPLMKFGKKLVSANGSIRGVDFDVSMPEIVQYDEIEMRVSDVPGIGAVLSNIPLPIAGMKGSFDMGVELKYNLPVGTGLMINEFDSNPEGSDNGTEWAELYNATSKEIDLSGYMLVPGSGDKKAIIITGEKIPAWGKTVINFEKQSLNNAKSGKFNGERLTLYDFEGNKIDETPWKKDSYNDSRTWQRSTDGSTSWEFLDGTPEARNGGAIKTNAFAKEFIIDSLMEAGEDAFFKMGNHLKSIDDIAEFLKTMLEMFIQNIIEKIADCIVSASVFLELEITDYAETQHNGVRVALEMNSDLVEEGLKWLLSQTGLLGDFVDAPSCTDPLNIVCENTYFRTTVYTGIGTPKFLSNAGGPTVTIGLTAAVNISGICELFGHENGKWKANVGIVMEDIPKEMLPGSLKTDSGKCCDLWLITMELSENR